MSTRVDDPSIHDSETLWRRILPTSALVVQEEDGRCRPSSAAFLDGYTGEVSVHRARLTTPERIVARHPQVGVAEIVALLPRSFGYALVADPIEEDPSHALICPPASLGAKKRKEHARRMALAATWVVPPPQELKDTEENGSPD